MLKKPLNYIKNKTYLLYYGIILYQGLLLSKITKVKLPSNCSALLTSRSTSHMTDHLSIGSMHCFVVIASRQALSARSVSLVSDQ